jgi:hypothetical protein
MITPTHRPLPDNTQHSQETNLHASDGIAKLQSQHARAEPRLRPLHHWDRKSGNIAALILNFGTKWRWAVSITFQPLYPLGRSPRNPFNKTVAGARFWSGLFGEENDFFAFSRTTQSLGQTALSLNSIPTELTQFYSSCHFQIFRITL